jgi:hypothetical protein
MIEWAGKVGPFTARLVEGILTSRPHPEMGYRSALGVIRLERKYGAERLEAASASKNASACWWTSTGRGVKTWRSRGG